MPSAHMGVGPLLYMSQTLALSLGVETVLSAGSLAACFTWRACCTSRAEEFHQQIPIDILRGPFEQS